MLYISVIFGEDSVINSVGNKVRLNVELASASPTLWEVCFLCFLLFLVGVDVILKIYGDGLSEDTCAIYPLDIFGELTTVSVYLSLYGQVGVHTTWPSWSSYSSVADGFSYYSYG